MRVVILAILLAGLMAGCESQAQVICPTDFKECPDGTLLSREGPNCEFESCRIDCRLYQDYETGKYYCVGCSSDVCGYSRPGVILASKEGFRCQATSQGCVLVD